MVKNPKMLWTSYLEAPQRTNLAFSPFDVERMETVGGRGAVRDGWAAFASAGDRAASRRLALAGGREL